MFSQLVSGMLWFFFIAVRCFVFKHKTAYDRRISDWISCVCSSDLSGEGVWADFFGNPAYTMTRPLKMQQMTGAPIVLAYAERLPFGRGYISRFQQIGRTSCRERVCTYV